jgi:hypothetical protein
MNREQYFELKRYIRTLCMDSVIDLATNVGLNSYETTILLHLNKNDTRIHTSLDLGVCESKVTRDTRKIFLKLNDYLKRQD